jgi:hypothetical protein
MTIGSIKRRGKARELIACCKTCNRHGLLTAETDAKYLEISQRLRGSIYPLPGPA